jgi:hypothetical protein
MVAMESKKSSNGGCDQIPQPKFDETTARLYGAQPPNVTKEHKLQSNSPETSSGRATGFFDHWPHTGGAEVSYNNAWSGTSGLYSIPSTAEYNAIMDYHSASLSFIYPGYLSHNRSILPSAPAYNGQYWEHSVPFNHFPNDYTLPDASVSSSSTLGSANFRHGSLYNIYLTTPPCLLIDAIGKENNPLLDFVEEGSERVLLRDVPKQMLEIFLGRRNLAKFVCALELDDNGVPILEEIRLPQFSTSHIALKIMVAWMHRACRQRQGLHQIAVPDNLFAAITLARTLRLFGREIDAQAVDHAMSEHHYNKPLDVGQLKPVWNFLPKHSQYVARVIEMLKYQLKEYARAEDRTKFPQVPRLCEFIDGHPDLRNRVYADMPGQEIDMSIASPMY